MADTKQLKLEINIVPSIVSGAVWGLIEEKQNMFCGNSEILSEVYCFLQK